LRSRESSVGVATGYGLDDRGSKRGSDKKEIILNSTASRPALGPTQPTIQWALGAYFPEVQVEEREADHSHPTSSEV
jgi:hypothetical protein